MRLSLGCEMAEVTRFQGSKGLIELREFSVTYAPQAGIDLSPSYYDGSYPAAMRNDYVKKWHEEHDPKPGQEPDPATTTWNGNDYDDLRPHIWKFFDAVRSRQAVVQDAVFGHHAALGCHMANESYSLLIRACAVSLPCPTPSSPDSMISTGTNQYGQPTMHQIRLAESRFNCRMCKRMIPHTQAVLYSMRMVGPDLRSTSRLEAGQFRNTLRL